MTERMPQTLANHPRLITGFHFIAFGLLVACLLYRLYLLVRFPAVATAFGVIEMVVLGLLFYYCRIFALTVQDRVIRLEERLRLARLSPGDPAAFDTLTRRQLVALRFAPDEEVVGLARRVVGGELVEPKAIKQAIKTWRPDYLRA